MKPTAVVTFLRSDAVVTSTAIAKMLDVPHSKVVQALELTECSAEFRQRNFASAAYTDEQGKPRPMFNITRDGFMWLAMEIAGGEAAEVKVALIEIFNAMERALLYMQPDLDDPRVMQRLLSQQMAAALADGVGV